MYPIILLYLTFCGYPLISLILSKLIKINTSALWIKLIVGFFLIYDTLLVFNISFKGDYIDYTLLSLEYLLLCLYIFFAPDPSSIISKLSMGIGVIIFALSLIFTLFSMILFPLLAQNYESSHVVHFYVNDKNYTTRQYDFGTIGANKIRHTFNTYKTFSALPFEYHIDRTDFPGWPLLVENMPPADSLKAFTPTSSKVEFNGKDFTPTQHYSIDDGNFDIQIKTSNDKSFIVFSHRAGLYAEKPLF